MRITRRGFLLGAAGLGAGLLGARIALPRLWRVGPPRPLTGEADAFVERCFAGLDRSRMWDAHVHGVGLPEGGNGAWVNPRWRSRWSLVRNLQFDLYLGAAGVEEDGNADAAYVERLLALHRAANPEGRLLLFAFDAFVHPDGTEDRELSSIVVPDGYVLDLAERHAEFVPVASVHPYRADAIDRLQSAAERGARAIKWLPNAMGIDPADARCDAFYRRLADLGLTLVSHGGVESAVEAGGGQHLGDPTRLRRALEAGVRVCVAHCGSLGEVNEREMFDLFLELMRDERWTDRVFADISALTFVNRSGRILRDMLLAEELHGRLVNGSDYPLVAVDPVISTRLLRWHGYLDADDARLCEEVYAANPLLFDFVVKRSLRVEEDGREHRFADAVFETDWLFTA